MNIKHFEEFTPRVPNPDWEEQAGMLSDFATESLELLMEAKNAVLTLETVPNDLQALNNAFKVFYTIAGLSGFLGLLDIQRLAKDTEELFDLWRKGSLSFDSKLIEISLEAIDTHRKLLDLLSEQILLKSDACDNYLNIKPVLEKIYNIKCSMQIGESSASFKKTPKRLPIEPEDSRSKMIKRQQELINERELAIRLSQQAQREAAEKSEMLANMSHEMRTLINAILGFSELLIKNSKQDKHKEFLSSIRSSATMLLEIINNILDLAKIEKGKIKFEKESFHLQSLTEEVFRIMRTRLEGKPIRLYFSIDPSAPQLLKGDPTRLRQILINLIGNAVKFTQKGEIALKVQAMKQLSENEISFLFKVSDTGIGIPKSRQHFIFEPFTQGDKTVAREYGGTGLGLTISKGYVRAMGGEMWVESQAGKGSDFSFSVPLGVDFSGAEKGEDVAPNREFADKTVVIIDSDPHKSLQEACKQLGLSIALSLENFSEAYEKLKQKSSESEKIPDAVFVEALNSLEDAHCFVKNIRNDPLFCNTKIIAVASDIRISICDDHAVDHFDDFLFWPIIKDEVLAIFSKIFQIKIKEKAITVDDVNDNLSCRGISILIVDDSLTNLELIKAFFESIGCEGDYAQNGEEAIEKIKEKKYDICFMDLQMPVMDGYMAVQIIREKINSDIPIIALTAADISEDKEHCIKIGFNDFLTKPFDMQEFQDKIIQYGRRS